MTDFVIVALGVAAVALATPSPAPASGGAEAASVAARVKAPDAPTVGFKVYASLEACERAAVLAILPRGGRAVCVPVEPMGEFTAAH